MLHAYDKSVLESQRRLLQEDKAVLEKLISKAQARQNLILAREKRIARLEGRT